MTQEFHTRDRESSGFQKSHTLEKVKIDETVVTISDDELKRFKHLTGFRCPRCIISGYETQLQKPDPQPNVKRMLYESWNRLFKEQEQINKRRFLLKENIRHIKSMNRASYLNSVKPELNKKQKRKFIRRLKQALPQIQKEIKQLNTRKIEINLSIRSIQKQIDQIPKGTKNSNGNITSYEQKAELFLHRISIVRKYLPDVLDVALIDWDFIEKACGQDFEELVELIKLKHTDPPSNRDIKMNDAETIIEIQLSKLKDQNQQFKNLPVSASEHWLREQELKKAEISRELSTKESQLRSAWGLSP